MLLALGFVLAALLVATIVWSVVRYKAIQVEKAYYDAIWTEEERQDTTWLAQAKEDLQ